MWAGPSTPVPDAPRPRFTTWEAFLLVHDDRALLKIAGRKAARSNQKRLLSDAVDYRLTASDVLDVLKAAHGRCVHCGSLAVEARPSTAAGAPLPWASVGRRIGSLDHSVPRILSGSNRPDNLQWCCLWCNTWPAERRPGATDHGGIHLPCT